MTAIHNRLVIEGYGSLKEVKKMTAHEVVQALAYLAFCDDCEHANTELAKKDAT